MIRNYFTSALRNILKHKNFSVINVFGLSISLAVCMLILLVIQDQVSYDKFHKDYKRIYRIQSRDELSKNSMNKYASSTWPLAKELKDNYPFAEEVVALCNRFQGEGISEEKRINIDGFFATSSFFDVFGFRLKNNPGSNPLEEPFSIVLTEEVAARFFGDKDPVGETLLFEEFGSFKISGIIESTRKKSQFQFEALVSASTITSLEREGKIVSITENWDKFYSNYIYVLLKDNALRDDLDEALKDIAARKYSDSEKVKVAFYSFPLSKIVPGPMLSNEIGMFLPKAFIIFFAGLAIVIMASAVFNYTSLSIARSLMRAREYGIRKSFGASRNQLISQILAEAVIIALISFLFAVIMLQFLIPAFSGMKFMTMLRIDPNQNALSYTGYFIFALLTGFLAGIIPALYISSINPIKVFKATSNIRVFKRVTFRKILLVIQYVFSIIFIISIILIYRQMNFMLNNEVGFDKEAVFNFDLRDKDFSKIKDQFSQLPEVEIVSAASYVPGIGNRWGIKIKMRPEDESYDASYFSVDPSYIDAMGIRIVAGEDFIREATGNSNSIIINKMAVEYFKFSTPQAAIGESMIINDTMNVRIVGVVDDYKYSAVFLPLKPLVIRVNPEQFNVAVLRMNTTDREASAVRLRELWSTIDPYHEMEGAYLDHEIKDYYGLFGDVLYTVGFAAILAILVACLGMLGMATYSIHTRLREVGIRKVFGSQSGSIALLISRSFLIMLLTASIIAAPIAYIINTMWLKFLAFKVSFGIGTILAGVIIVFLTGILTILSQTIKAANSNPVDILKYE